jgi:hypothetical protein
MSNYQINFMTNEVILIFPLSTSLTYVAVFLDHLHIVFILCSRFDMVEPVLRSVFRSRQTTDTQVDDTRVYTVSF